MGCIRRLRLETLLPVVVQADAFGALLLDAAVICQRDHHTAFLGDGHAAVEQFEFGVVALLAVEEVVVPSNASSACLLVGRDFESIQILLLEFAMSNLPPHCIVAPFN